MLFTLNDQLKDWFKRNLLWYYYPCFKNFLLSKSEKFITRSIAYAIRRFSETAFFSNILCKINSSTYFYLALQENHTSARYHTAFHLNTKFKLLKREHRFVLVPLI